MSLSKKNTFLIIFPSLFCCGVCVQCGDLPDLPALRRHRVLLHLCQVGRHGGSVCWISWYRENSHFDFLCCKYNFCSLFKTKWWAPHSPLPSLGWLRWWPPLPHCCCRRRLQGLCGKWRDFLFKTYWCHLGNFQETPWHGEGGGGGQCEHQGRNHQNQSHQVVIPNTILKNCFPKCFLNFFRVWLQSRSPCWLAGGEKNWTFF